MLMTLGNYRVRGGAQVQEGYKKDKVGLEYKKHLAMGMKWEEGLAHIFGGSCFSGRLL